MREQSQRAWHVPVARDEPQPLRRLGAQQLRDAACIAARRLRLAFLHDARTGNATLGQLAREDFALFEAVPGLTAAGDDLQRSLFAVGSGGAFDAAARCMRQLPAWHGATQHDQHVEAHAA